MRESIKCFFGFHDWKCIKALGYDEIREHLNHDEEFEEVLIPSTRATYRCECCRKLKYEIHFGVGYLTIEEINGDE